MATLTKIASTEVKMQGGSQRSYFNPTHKKTYYYYIIEFENGWKGEVSSLTADIYPIPVGTEVEVDMTKAGDGNKLPTYKVQKPNGGRSDSGGSWDDPIQTQRVAMGICQECSIITYIHAKREPEDVEEVLDRAQTYFVWVTDAGKVSDRKSLTNRWYAIRNAVNSMQDFTPETFLPNKELNPEAGFTTTNIILMAERFLVQIEKIS